MNLAEVKKGEMNATLQQQKLGAAIERTMMVRAEADALIAASKHKECVLVARALKVGRQFFLCAVLSEGLFAHVCWILHSFDPHAMGVETGEGPTSRGQETSTRCMDDVEGDAVALTSLDKPYRYCCSCGADDRSSKMQVGKRKRSKGCNLDKDPTGLGFRDEVVNWRN